MKRLTEQQRIEIAELREAGWSYRRLALRFGVSDGAIHYHCLKQGALSPRYGGKVDVSAQSPLLRSDGRIQRRFTAQEDDQMQALSREGLSPNRIAERMGRAPTSVRMRLMALAYHEEAEAA